ncbi:MAG: hypothetical protein AABZ39_16065 [Spirochaetota bacterium]
MVFRVTLHIVIALMLGVPVYSAFIGSITTIISYDNITVKLIATNGSKTLTVVDKNEAAVGTLRIDSLKYPVARCTLIEGDFRRIATGQWVRDKGSEGTRDGVVTGATASAVDIVTNAYIGEPPPRRFFGVRFAGGCYAPLSALSNFSSMQLQYSMSFILDIAPHFILTPGILMSYSTNSTRLGAFYVSALFPLSGTNGSISLYPHAGLGVIYPYDIVPLASAGIGVIFFRNNNFSLIVETAVWCPISDMAIIQKYAGATASLGVHIYY